MKDRAADALRELLGAAKVLSDRPDLEHYGRDWTRQSLPDPSAVVLPESIEDVQAVVRWARSTGAKLVPSGG